MKKTNKITISVLAAALAISPMLTTITKTVNNATEVKPIATASASISTNEDAVATTPDKSEIAVATEEGKTYKLEISYKFGEKVLKTETKTLKHGEKLVLDPSSLNKDGITYGISSKFKVPVLNDTGVVKVDVPLIEKMAAMSLKPAVTKYRATVIYKLGDKAIKAVPVLVEKGQSPVVENFEKDGMIYSIPKDYKSPVVTLDFQAIEVQVRENKKAPEALPENTKHYAHLVFLADGKTEVHKEILLVNKGTAPTLKDKVLEFKGEKYKIDEKFVSPEIILESQLVEVPVIKVTSTESATSDLKEGEFEVKYLLDKKSNETDQKVIKTEKMTEKKFDELTKDFNKTEKKHETFKVGEKSYEVIAFSKVKKSDKTVGLSFTVKEVEAKKEAEFEAKFKLKDSDKVIKTEKMTEKKFDELTKDFDIAKKTIKDFKVGDKVYEVLSFSKDKADGELAGLTFIVKEVEVKKETEFEVKFKLKDSDKIIKSEKMTEKKFDEIVANKDNMKKFVFENKHYEIVNHSKTKDGEKVVLSFEVIETKVVQHKDTAHIKVQEVHAGDDKVMVKLPNHTVEGLKDLAKAKVILSQEYAVELTYDAKTMTWHQDGKALTPDSEGYLSVKLDAKEVVKDRMLKVELGSKDTAFNGGVETKVLDKRHVVEEVTEKPTKTVKKDGKKLVKTGIATGMSGLLAAISGAAVLTMKKFKKK